MSTVSVPSSCLLKGVPSAKSSAFTRPQLSSIKSISKAFGFKSFSKFKVSAMAAYNVILIGPDDNENEIEVPEDQYILDTAEDAGMELPYSCRAGTCGTCAGYLSSGSVDQSEGSFLNESLIEKGYVLTCISYPRADCVIHTHKQDELMN